MAIKPLEILGNIARAKEIVTVLARNGFADLLQRMDLPPRILSALGSRRSLRVSQWERLRIVLEQLGPTFIKVGQLLSVRPDVVPRKLIEELSKLQEHVAPEPFAKVRPLIEQELGGSIDDFFSHIEEVAVAGASIAQVHFGTLKESGASVAIKVQRPGIERTVEADFDILLWFARQAHERLDELRPYNLPTVFETLREGIERELNFSSEARSMVFFALRNPYPEKVHVPEVHESLCSRKLLVMERVEGLKPSELQPGSELARRMAKIGSQSLFNQILIDGFFHADPHGGNLRVLNDGRLCLLDWGLVGQLTRRMRYGLVDLFLAFVRGDAEDVVRVAANLAESGSPIDKRSMERQVMVSMREHYNPDTGKGDISKAVVQLLYIFGRNGIDLARDYSLMAKALLCVEETGKALDPGYNLRDEFEPVLVELMKERRSLLRLAGETRRSVLHGLEYLKTLPDDLRTILKKIEMDTLKINLQHKGLDRLDATLADASNKVTLGIILGCVVVGSSIVIATKIPPLLFGYPILGLIGYIISVLLGIWVAFDILRGGPKR